MLWIDTTTGTWGEVDGSNGKLVLLPDHWQSHLENASDSEIAEIGLTQGVDIENVTSPPLKRVTAKFLTREDLAHLDNKPVRLQSTSNVTRTFTGRLSLRRAGWWELSDLKTGKPTNLGPLSILTWVEPYDEALCPTCGHTR